VSTSIIPNWQIFVEQYPQFIRLQRQLAETDWFVRDGWVMFIGLFHAGIFAQLYKLHWYNHTLDGIHVEFGIDAGALEAKRATIDLHIGHRNLFDREQFNELTIPQMAEIVATWDGDYTFSTTNLSQRLSVRVPFTKTGFPKQLAAALTQLSEFGPIIDEGLAMMDTGES
jgi:hypothetical protein